MLVAKNGTVDDLIQALIKKAQLEDEVTAGVIDLYETHNHKIHKELSREATVINVADYTHLIAERVPAENLEDEQGEAPQTIYAYHFQGEPSKSHGIPFKFRVIPVSKCILFSKLLLIKNRAKNSSILRNVLKRGRDSKARISRR